MTDDLTRIAIPLSNGLLERVDDFRFSHRIASRAEAIRQLLETGLEHQPRRVIVATRRVERS